MGYLVLRSGSAFRGPNMRPNCLASPAVTRLSRYFLPTTREAPADAEAISHKLIVRAGLARQLGAGLWTFLPAGWRAPPGGQQKIPAGTGTSGGGGIALSVL